MNKLFIGLLALVSISVFAQDSELPIEVTCWNSSGAQVLKVKARYAFSEGGNGNNIFKILVGDQNRNNPDYFLVNSSCLVKKL